jgi:Zn ribbon nucleic-acid-binding protein
MTKVADCPKCKGVAVDITPLKKKDERVAVYGCQHCGYAFTSDGKAFVQDGEALQDIFRGATEGNKALVDMLLGTGEEVNPATKALLSARMLEYGLTMWFDGVKQGILLGTIQTQHKAKGE